MSHNETRSRLLEDLAHARMRVRVLHLEIRLDAEIERELQLLRQEVEPDSGPSKDAGPEELDVDVAVVGDRHEP